MSRAVKKTSFLGRLFYRLPSERELEARRAASRQSIVRKVSTGNYLLQRGRYLTEEDIEEKRQRLLGAN